jgi:hypothetical protein
MSVSIKELKLDHGRVAGEQYYTVHPVFIWPDSDIWFNEPWYDIERWCIDTFGPTPKDGVWTPGMRWYKNNSKFWFRAQEDLSWFLLKWQ